MVVSLKYKLAGTLLLALIAVLKGLLQVTAISSAIFITGGFTVYLSLKL